MNGDVHSMSVWWGQGGGGRGESTGLSLLVLTGCVRCVLCVPLDLLDTQNIG